MINKITNNFDSKVFQSFLKPAQAGSQVHYSAPETYNQDAYISSSTVNQETPKAKNKNLLTYIAPGVAVLLGGLYILNRIKRGKTSSKNIPQGISDTLNRTANDIQKTTGDFISDNSNNQANFLAALIENKQKLGVFDDKFFNGYLESAKPESLKFMTSEGVKIFADGAEKLKSKYDLVEHEILSIFRNFSKDNKDVFKILVDKVDDYGITSHKVFNSLLKAVNPKHKDFIFNDLIPTLFKNKEKFMIESAGDLSGYLKSITPQNKDFALRQVMPLLERCRDKLNLNSSSQMASILGHITNETIDVIETVAKQASKLGLDYSDDFILAVTPQNKKCIPLIAENAEKLGIREFLEINDFKKLLDKGEGEIRKLIEA